MLVLSCNSGAALKRRHWSAGCRLRPATDLSCALAFICRL